MEQNFPTAEVRRELDKILVHPLFQKSQRLSIFLRYVVEKALAGETESLKELVIGSEAFQRGETFDPQIDNVVRVNANRLRSKLAEYYQTNGNAAQIRIDLPRGGYVPVFSDSPQIPERSFQSEPAQPSGTVGRERELWRLRSALDSISKSGGRMLAISGDAGIGKTALIEDFLLTGQAQPGPMWVARGRCSERLEKTDPFVPILQCLDNLISGDGAAEALQIMETTAPLWLSQVRPTSSAQSASVVSSERLRREFVRFFQALSAIRPILLFVDDLHWVDASTCDLLEHLGSQAREIRILLVAAYRSAKVRTAHPFLPLKLTFERQDAWQEVSLGFLSRSDVESYLSGRFSPCHFPANFADAVYERTEGHPLFMKDMIGFLVDRQMIVKLDGSWQLKIDINDIRTLIPTGTESMIRLQIDQFSDLDRQILRCAAVQGVEFDSAVICRVLALEAEQVEERLQSLARIHCFVAALDERTLGGEIFSVRYRFVHVIYQNALYADLPPTRRATQSAAVAESLLNLATETMPVPAAELGILFERGRDKARAAEQFLQAARHAVAILAFPEAVLLCERGLGNLLSLPASRDRDERELEFLLTLGMAQMVTSGYASPQVERTYRRARELCLRLAEKKRLVRVLWALHTCLVNAGELVPALQLAAEMLQLAEELNNTVALIESSHAMGTTLAFMGKLPEAKAHLEKTLQLAAARGSKSQRSLYILDPYVTSLSMLARVLARMGFMDEAMRKAIQSVSSADQLSHPPSVAYATFWVGWLHHARGEHTEACVHLESAMELSRTYGMPQFLEWARVLRGSSLASLGKVEEGISEMRTSLANQSSMRCLVERPFCLMLLAESLLKSRRYPEALQLCDDALEIVERTEARSYESEIRLLRMTLAGGLSGIRPS
jgi:predicted ATPase